MNDNALIIGFFLIIIIILIIIYKSINNKNINKNVKNNSNIKNLINENNIENKIKIEEISNEVETSQNENLMPYRRKYLLTRNELDFYKKLKIIANEKGYSVLAKVRLADIIEINNEIDQKNYIKYFNKIASKHIDFVLCNPNNLYIEYLIELDDNSHNTIQRQERDKFIEELSIKTGYKLIRTKSIEHIKEIINNNNNIPPIH